MNIRPPSLLGAVTNSLLNNFVLFSTFVQVLTFLYSNIHVQYFIKMIKYTLIFFCTHKIFLKNLNGALLFFNQTRNQFGIGYNLSLLDITRE
jgi:hypothetical protein